MVIDRQIDTHRQLHKQLFLDISIFFHNLKYSLSGFVEPVLLLYIQELQILLPCTIEHQVIIQVIYYYYLYYITSAIHFSTMNTIPYTIEHQVIIQVIIIFYLSIKVMVGVHCSRFILRIVTSSHYLSLYLYISIYISIYLYIYLSIYLSIYLLI